MLDKTKKAKAKMGLRGAKKNSRVTQNTSDAVMAQRGIDGDSLDDFPTPPWATRALLTHIIRIDPLSETALEPAAGRGYMSEVLKEYFSEVTSFDVADYGYCPVLPGGFVEAEQPLPDESYDWVITNPPFKLMEAFTREALRVARRGVAMLCRTVIIEGQHRYEHLYSVARPSIIAQYTERVPMVEGQFDPKASTATGYCWIIWDKDAPKPRALYPTSAPMLQTTLAWIPPCRKILETPVERINALMIVAKNERDKAVALKFDELADQDVLDAAADHEEKSFDRWRTACKELAALDRKEWPKIRDVDGSTLKPRKISAMIKEILTPAE